MPDPAQQLHAADATIRLDEAIQARVKDPLWFLARQWQVGEFAGSNGGRPASAAITWSSFDLQTVDRSGSQEPVDLDAPLEWAIEREAPEGTSRAWQSAALEHVFTLRTPAHELRGDDYASGSLDWYGVDLIAATDAAPTTTATRRVVPTQIAIPGAPHPRWWRLEDADAYLDSPDDPEPNVLSVLLPELGYIDVNDWYVAPLEQRAGTMRRIDDFILVDSFGIATQLMPLASGQWRVFALTTKSVGADLLFVPNSAAAIVDNDVIEDTRFLPDETANVVWAFEFSQLEAEAPAAPPSHITGGPPQFRFSAPPPTAWIPYLPRDGYLRRGRTDPVATAANPQYQGRIVAEAWRLDEHQIPAEGVRVRRLHRYARGTNSQEYFWVGRRVEVTQRGSLPHTRFDFLDESDSSV
jgi:hypothetical protein